MKVRGTPLSALDDIKLRIIDHQLPETVTSLPLPEARTELNMSGHTCSYLDETSSDEEVVYRIL